jgi:hypothetical protein
MEIFRNGENLLDRWQKDRAVLDVEITVGHVWMTFSGVVKYFDGVELVLSHADGELSISLFCGNSKVVEPSAEQASNSHWQKYRRTVMVNTDGGATCVLHERRSA